MEYAEFENFETLKFFIYGWMDSWIDGWMGYQKCPSIFFILFAYIDHIGIYVQSKLVTNILMGLKI